jgi:hypothetical protein
VWGGGRVGGLLQVWRDGRVAYLGGGAVAGQRRRLAARHAHAPTHARMVHTECPHLDFLGGASAASPVTALSMPSAMSRARLRAMLQAGCRGCGACGRPQGVWAGGIGGTAAVNTRHGLAWAVRAPMLACLLARAPTHSRAATAWHTAHAARHCTQRSTPPHPHAAAARAGTHICRRCSS